MSEYLTMDYREIIAKQIEMNKHKKGYRAALAKAAGFQQSYLSQVLSGVGQITLDQAFSISNFFKFDDQQTDTFLTKVNIERASSPDLRKFLSKKLEHSVAIPNASSLEVSDYKISFEDTLFIYSDWKASAIHACLQIPNLSKIDSIATRLSLPPETVEEILNRFLKLGLVRRVRKSWNLIDNRQLYLYDHQTIHQIYNNALNLKANTQSNFKKVSSFLGGIHAVPANLEVEFQREILKAYHKLVTPSKLDENATLLGLSFNLFHL